MTTEIARAMKVSVSKEELYAAVRRVLPAVAMRSTLPVTSMILMEAKEGRLRLAATNLSFSIETYAEAEIPAEGAVCVSAEKLASVVDMMAGKITLSLRLPSRRLILTADGKRAEIAGVDAEEFPPIPGASDAGGLVLNSAAFRTALQRSSIAVAELADRPILTCLCVQRKDMAVVLIGADGYRLSVARMDCGGSAEGPDLLLPGASAKAILRLLDAAGETVTLSVNERGSQASVVIGETRIIVQLADGSYLNFAQLVPQGAATTAVVDSSALLAACKAAMIFARESSNIVRCQFEGGRAIVSGMKDEIGMTEMEIAARLDGDPIKIAFNGDYLKDVLTVANGDASIRMNSPSAPLVLTLPAEVEAWTYIFMPMYVTW